METLRDKSKRLLRQVQLDTEEAIKDQIVENKLYTVDDQKTIINIHLLDLSDDIKKITEKLEDLVSNPTIRPDVRKEILSIISLLI